jgi:hypothetical protein
MISSVLSITVLSNVPHLDPEGANWAIFAFHFWRAMILASHWDYFDSSDMHPILTDLSNITDVKKLDCKWWDYEDIIAQCLLGQHLPNETAMDMEGFLTAEVQWSTINALFTMKSMYTKADLHQAFSNMCCLKGGDV